MPVTRFRPVAASAAPLLASTPSFLPAWGATDEFKVTLLGTGSPVPVASRCSQSTLVQVGGQTLLFDFGRGASVRLAQIEVPIGSITAHFLTHVRSDHLNGLPDLGLPGWLPTPFGSRRSPMIIYGPEGTVAMTSNLTEAFAAGIRIRIADELLAPEGIAEQARGADLLIHEVANIDPELADEFPRVKEILNHHTTPEEAGRIFTQARPKLAVYLYLVEFLPGKGLADDIDAESIIERTRTTYDGPLLAGADLMAFEIGDEVEVIGPSGENASE